MKCRVWCERGGRVHKAPTLQWKLDDFLHSERFYGADKRYSLLSQFLSSINIIPTTSMRTLGALLLRELRSRPQFRTVEVKEPHSNLRQKRSVICRTPQTGAELTTPRTLRPANRLTPLPIPSLRNIGLANKIAAKAKAERHRSLPAKREAAYWG